MAPNLYLIDLNDNYISDLQQVQNLKQIGSLTDVVFMGKNSSNPICDFENYTKGVVGCLP